MNNFLHFYRDINIARVALEDIFYVKKFYSASDPCVLLLDFDSVSRHHGGKNSCLEIMLIIFLKTIRILNSFKIRPNVVFKFKENRIYRNVSDRLVCVLVESFLIENRIDESLFKFLSQEDKKIVAMRRKYTFNYILNSISANKEDYKCTTGKYCFISIVDKNSEAMLNFNRLENKELFYYIKEDGSCVNYAP